MRWISSLAVFTSFALFQMIGNAQEVVSAQSGVINYTEGVVLVDDVPLDRQPATFPLLKEGCVLRTEKGRAELMLTPDVFLRVDDNSSIKMLTSALTATSVELLKGSAIVDALAAQGNIPVTLRYKDAAISFTKPGLYRVDSDTEVLQAYSGEASVKQQEKQTQIDQTRLYFFELNTDTKKFDDGTEDEFLDWARNRNEVITAENQATQAENDDANADPDLNSLPFNFNAPFGSLNAAPSIPSYGSIYPYNGFFYNNFAAATLWPVPLLPGPAIIIGRPWGYRSTTTRAWPSTGSWIYHHTAPTTTVLSFPRPTSVYSHPYVSHPLVAPHVSAPAVHAGRK